MKRLSRILTMILLAVLVVPSVALAGQTRSGDETVTVPVGTTINDDLYVAGGTVTMSGTINGDLLVAGGTVTVDGVVNGDLWIVGGTVNVTGTVVDDVRVGGGTVTVSSNVGGDLLVGGGNTTVSRTANIGQDLWAASGALTMDGTVGRNLKAGSGDLTINGVVRGNVNANVDALTLGPQAQVTGNISYKAPRELKQETGAQVTGQINFTKQKQEKRDDVGGRLWGQLYWFLAAVLLLLAVLLYARRGAKVAADFVIAKPWWSLLFGLIFTIVTPLVALLLLITLVGFPLSAITVLLYVLVLYSAKIFVALAVGGLIIKQKKDSFWLAFGAGVLGLAIFYLLAALPIIGWLVSLLTLFFGIGAQLLLAKQLYGENRKKYGV